MLATETNDWLLLREYVERRSEPAFETLVRRHLNMVYSAALRQAGDPDVAEEVTQAVFVLFARKASRLGRGVILAGWLYRAACLTARRALRDQTRRRIKDREAIEMNLNDPEDQVWSRLMPHLDSALASLNDTDRTAIVLRFLERRNFRDVAAAMSLSEDAAKKRVARALEKLRVAFHRKGVAFGVGAMAAALSEKASAAAPPGLLKSSVEAGVSSGTAVAPAVGTLVAEVLREILISRLKWGVAVAGIGFLLVASGTSHRATVPISPAEQVNVPLHEHSGIASSKPVLLPLKRSPSSAVGRTMTFNVLADENGQPLGNVAIYAEFIALAGKTVDTSYVTGEAGSAQIELPSEINFMNFWAATPGRVPTTVSWNTKVTVESLPPDYTLRLPLGRFVAGTVVDETGRPVAGAKVHIQSDGMAPDSREYPDYEGPPYLEAQDRQPMPTTDANGRWSTDFISPKATSVMGYLEHPDFATTQFGHIHPPDPIEPSTNIVLVLKRGGSVAGIVRDVAGNPIPGASVMLKFRLMFPLGGQLRGVFTDAGGRFKFSQVADEEVFIEVNANGFKSIRNMPAAGTNIGIVLKPRQVAGTSLIRGRVFSPDGSPVSNVLVSVAPGQRGLKDIDWAVNTAADGRFAWSSAPDHPVKLLFTGAIWDWEKQEVELAPDGTEASITLRPEGRVRVHGTITDKSNGVLVPQFEVLWATGFEKGYIVNTSVLADGRDGKFSAEMLPEDIQNYPPPGSSTRLEFVAPGFLKKVVLLNSGTNNIELAVQLEPGQTTNVAPTAQAQ